MEHFDVIVIGGGHAGCEAAAVASRMGARTALVSMKATDLGAMSCNPAIGGLGKGHLVREIDAFDGLMGKAADAAGIQFRLLNRRKGPAVQGPRAQADRKVYATWMQNRLAQTPNLELVFAEVVDLMMDGDTVNGVELADASFLRGRSVILTTGTFLGGVIHMGMEQKPGGRVGDKSSTRLAERMREFSLPLGRLKTGTPPRLDRSTIDWDILEEQPGDPDPTLFSFLSKVPDLQQVPCHITHTNSQTHDIIRTNLDKSAMYSGNISGKGPRYCPSIEDKIVRFADKQSHQVFLEPEGLNSRAIYPNGISTSLPADVQDSYVRSIRGLGNAKILQLGYAIEYDYVDPRALDRALSVKDINGLFLAGQINGTTGYEEAAAQGLVAGINAVRHARNEPGVEFSRSQSYIGVMIDDLVSRGVSEPYRMFTSRAEYRLSLRADNADQRLTPLAMSLGCVAQDRKDTFTRKMDLLEEAKTDLVSIEATPNELRLRNIAIAQDGTKRNGLQLLSLPQVSVMDMQTWYPSLRDIDAEILIQLEREALYSNYLERQSSEIAEIHKDEQIEIPAGFDYDSVSSLSGEIRRKLKEKRPKSIAHAKRIEGMTPAALIILIGQLKKQNRASA